METKVNPSTRDIGMSGSPNIVYEDEPAAVGRVRLGASAPTWRTYDHGVGGGVAFDVLGFAVGNYIEFEVQTKHAMQLNTVLDCHMHYVMPNSTNPDDKFQFQLDVIAAAIGVSYAVPAGSPFTAEHTIVAGDEDKNKILGLADIPAVNSTVSTLYTLRLTRIAASANEYGSEVYLKYVDCHYRLDTVGSLKETSKV